MKHLLVIFTAILVTSATAQQTVGVFKHDVAQTSQGYTLFAPVASKSTYLIDNDGQVVHSWTSQNIPGLSAMLLPDGSLLRTGNPLVQTMGGGGAGGIIERRSWDNELLWRYERIGPTYRTHHDVEIMPNGNVLLLEWQRYTRAEAIARGRDPKRLLDSMIYSERIIEVRPTGPTTGEIVWSWSAWDNLIQDFDETKLFYGVISEHPEKLNINTGDLRTDWLHFNSVRYSPERDEILVSVHNLDEVIVISRATGSIVYRWGNPSNYKIGAPSARKFFGQHDARWTDSSGTRITVFNNGIGRTASLFTDYSTLDEIEVPRSLDGTYAKRANGSYGPDTISWTYPRTPDTSFFAINISGAYRLPNGNTLACVGPDGIFSEITQELHEVWRYVNPVGDTGAVRQGVIPRNNLVFKITRYGPDYPAFVGRSLIPQGRLEDGPLVGIEEIFRQSNPIFTSLNILSRKVTISIPENSHVVLSAYDLAGRWLGVVVDEDLSSGSHVRDVPYGTYLIR
ncbi:MAG: aryl-sulfate sulfotransferase [Ignavibacteria bacterium]|nr:aryl-sulfate sulfotransferase [Ignavibacteria bacterium]MBP7093575.1 aryl-sulfate sulfotransferase [Candidatus Kapabacteria bacterium]MBK6419581.1 aryl-sulfate sulfotransferase [Ignavibacteria bacterium]MBK6759796.1 aryl-sulfate sulfotransferase [Ignavibacteria bacterium]MBK7033019.1 aryl-sulfate sulfotransferase [Ignavibacteria bacterium]